MVAAIIFSIFLLSNTFGIGLGGFLGDKLSFKLRWKLGPRTRPLISQISCVVATVLFTLMLFMLPSVCSSSNELIWSAFGFGVPAFIAMGMPTPSCHLPLISEIIYYKQLQKYSPLAFGLNYTIGALGRGLGYLLVGVFAQEVLSFDSESDPLSTTKNLFHAMGYFSVAPLAICVCMYFIFYIPGVLINTLRIKKSKAFEPEKDVDLSLDEPAGMVDLSLEEPVVVYNNFMAM